MSPDDNKKVFDEYFDSIFEGSNILTEDQFEKMAGGFNANFSKFIPQNKNSKILDIGCGCGHFLYYLKREGYVNFYGIDISSQQIDYCKKNISERAEIADVFEFLKDKKGAYDFISMISFLEHIPKEKILGLLGLVYDSLKKSGLLIVEVPNMANPLSLNLRYRDFSHEVGFTEISLKQVLWLAGFRDIQVFSPKVRVRSFRNLVRSKLNEMFFGLLKFLYYIQDFAVPENLRAAIIAVAKKQ